MDEDAERQTLEAWASSGAMHLTGRADGPPLGPPSNLVPGLLAAAEVLERRSRQLGREVAIGALELLGERAAIAGLQRRGQISCGGHTMLLPALDRWVAVTLARSEDVDLLPAWLNIDPFPTGADHWAAVADKVSTRTATPIVDQAALLGLPVAAIPAAQPNPPRAVPPLAPLPCCAIRIAEEPSSVARIDELVVLDLASLWAGPLCASLLAEAGATVVKVESIDRPDGARYGAAAFFDLMNAGKRSVSLDFNTASGRHALRALAGRADVIVEGSRPRALQQLGIDATALLTHAHPRVWISITGYGRGDGGHRAAFGDDAAVAGGLVAWERSAPVFCADAVADPASGLVAAAIALDALAVGGSWLLDVSLSGVAAHLGGPTLSVPEGVKAIAPTARRPRAIGPRLGADNASVLSDIGDLR